ncbi:MAG TPA: hypothetical protein VKM93_21180 [Terriglobia bacterium]|nr:hypothetical protein [Terriglobia bacterium]
MDLIAVVADKNMQFAVEGLLASQQRLGIRVIDFEVRRHPRHDPGLLRECHDFLQSWHGRAAYALVMLDREGCGSNEARDVLEAQVESRLAQSGWTDRSAAVVIDPELEVWVWSDSPHVATGLRCLGGQASLQEWLIQNGYLEEGQRKPQRPKEAVEDVLKLSRTPRSSSIYREIAKQVSFQHCIDPAFVKLRSVLAQWFPPQG